MRCALLLLGVAVVGCAPGVSGDEPQTLTSAVIPIDGEGWCGDGLCRSSEGEDCSWCTSDCGTCAVCNGTPGEWDGCRGNGCAVCAEKLAGYDCYFQNHPSCALNTTCAGQFYTCNAACPPPTEADRCGCAVDECATCGTPAPSADLDSDLVPDLLEQQLAYRFFPDVRLSHFVPDLYQSYAYHSKRQPFTATEYRRTGTICEEAFSCLELRFGLPYDYDCGDYKPLESTDYCDTSTSWPNQAHKGDSEFFAALVLRTAPWASARADASQWVMIRDFTAAHWGSSDAESSRMGARGYCAPNCGDWTNNPTACSAEPMCVYLGGRCYGTPTCSGSDAMSCSMSGQCTWTGSSCVQTGGSCLGWDYSQCREIPGCQWAPPSCQGRVKCDATVPASGAVTYYASEGKHALYHSVSECDSGGWFGADDCQGNAYSLRGYTVTNQLLQNIGQSGNYWRFDVTIDEPYLSCGVNHIWKASAFQASTPYKKHFTYAFGWPLPRPAVCGDGRCDANETCRNVSTGTGCSDCGTCPYCGDGVCNGDETQETCGYDCTVCGDGVCQGNEWNTCAWDCATCGDGYCDFGENCFEDCGYVEPY